MLQRFEISCSRFETRTPGALETRWQICRCTYVITPIGRFGEAHVIDVTVVFLDEMFSSTAIAPMEVFRHAGLLCNSLTGTRPLARFRVTTGFARWAERRRSVHRERRSPRRASNCLVHRPQAAF